MESSDILTDLKQFESTGQTQGGSGNETQTLHSDEVESLESYPKRKSSEGSVVSESTSIDSGDSLTFADGSVHISILTMKTRNPAHRAQTLGIVTGLSSSIDSDDLSENLFPLVCGDSPSFYSDLHTQSSSFHTFFDTGNSNRANHSRTIDPFAPPKPAVNQEELVNTTRALHQRSIGVDSPSKSTKHQRGQSNSFFRRPLTPPKKRTAVTAVAKKMSPLQDASYRSRNEYQLQPLSPARAVHCRKLEKPPTPKAKSEL